MGVGSEDKGGAASRWDGTRQPRISPRDSGRHAAGNLSYFQNFLLNIFRTVVTQTEASERADKEGLLYLRFFALTRTRATTESSPHGPVHSPGARHCVKSIYLLVCF